jgi:Fe-S-cluster containining protein
VDPKNPLSRRTLATELDTVGSILAEAGALAAPILPDIPPPPRHVDCGPCTACCHMAVFVGPWDTEEYELQPGTAILARRPETGACVYLDRQTGCTIYDRRPKASRAFSCKIFVENADGAQADALAAEHPQFHRVIAEGRRRQG